MKLKNRTVVLLILTGLLPSAGSQAEAKDHSKHFSNHRGGQAATQMSNKSSVSHNAQWSADPTRGWVRAAERRELPKPSAAAKTDREQKTKGKGY